MQSRSKPVVIVFSVLAALQILAGGAALGDVIGATAMGLFVLIVAAIQAGMSFYVQNQVTPWNEVVAKTSREGAVVAGPAASQTTGQLYRW